MSENKLLDIPAFPQDLQGRRGDDPQYQGMTIRQYAAIKLKVPNSGTDWLDEMILESLRNDLAAKALAAVMAEWAKHGPDNWEDEGKTTIAEVSYDFADAMLEARQKPRVEGVYGNV